MKNPSKHLPSAKDISPFDTLDELNAKKDFLGKTRGQAAALFFEHAEYYLEEVFWMGDGGFSYYLPAVIPFMESSESNEDSLFVISLLQAIGNRLEESPKAVRACREEVLHILRYIIANYQSKFDEPVDTITLASTPDELLYRNPPAEAARLLAELEAME